VFNAASQYLVRASPGGREKEIERLRKNYDIYSFHLVTHFEEFILIHVLDPDFTGKDHGARSRSVHIYMPRTDQLYQSCLHESTNAYITSFKRLPPHFEYSDYDSIVANL